MYGLLSHNDFVKFVCKLLFWFISGMRVAFCNMILDTDLALCCELFLYLTPILCLLIVYNDLQSNLKQSNNTYQSNDYV